MLPNWALPRDKECLQVYKKWQPAGIMWAELGSRQGKSEPETQRAFIHKPKLFFSKGIVDQTAVLMPIFSVILVHSDNNVVSRSPVQHGHFCVSTPGLVFLTLNSNCFPFILPFLFPKQIHAEGNHQTDVWVCKTADIL